MTRGFSMVVPGFELCRRVMSEGEVVQTKRFKWQLLYHYIPLTFFWPWAFGLIPVIGGLVYPTILVASVWWMLRLTTGGKRYESTLLYLVVMNWGLLGFRSFVGHTLMADMVAESIGWATGSMFQIELAFYHLGVAVASMTLLWNRSRALMLGLILAKSIFLFGAMGVHVYEALAMGNLSAGNIGWGIIYGDLVVPVLAIWLYLKSGDTRH